MAAASAFLSFLPMLPSQILLNNLLYDSSQLAIPTDRVDDEQLHAPSHWDIAFIRRFMLVFGPISLLYDLLAFGLMLGVLHAAPVEFRTGWFVESLATQTLIIFAIRNQTGTLLPQQTEWRDDADDGDGDRGRCPAHGVSGRPCTGFHHPAVEVYGALVLLIIAYLVLVEVTKKAFYAAPDRLAAQPHRIRGREHRIQRRAARFSHGGTIGRSGPMPTVRGPLTVGKAPVPL